METRETMIDPITPGLASLRSAAMTTSTSLPFARLASRSGPALHVRGLALRIVPGSELDEAELDAMWQLRARFLALKPDVDPARDRALFGAWLRAPGSMLAIGCDAEGVQTYIDTNARVVEHAGTRHVVLSSNFVFSSERYRNHPAYVIGFLANVAVQLQRHGLGNALLLSGLYPPSFVVVARTFPTTWIAGERDVPAPLAALTRRVAPDIFGEAWLPEPALIRTRTLPQPYVPSRPLTRALLRRYEARNPSWREGHTVLCITPLTLRNVLGCMRLAAARALGR
jgi:hypothetical protein